MREVSDLNLENESFVGRVDQSRLNLEALARNVGRRRDGRRHVDADVVDSSEASSAIAVCSKRRFKVGREKIRKLRFLFDDVIIKIIDRLYWDCDCLFFIEELLTERGAA